MPTYDAAIARTAGTDPLVPEPLIAEVIQEATKSSAALQLCRSVTLSSKTSRQPVLSTIPSAYWVTGDTGLKQTTAAEWDNVDLVVEEAAVIVPVPEAYVADSGVPIWDEVRPLLGQAIGSLLDAAALFGTGAPSTFGDSVFEVADGAGQTVTLGDTDDLASDIALLAQTIGEAGFNVTGFAAKPAFTWQLAGIRSQDGAPIYQPDLTASPTGRGLYGYPLAEVANGSWDADEAILLAGDWSKAIVGIRQDISYKVFDQGVITDGDGAVVLNLMQQDSVALRVVARYAFATANPANPTASGGAPFGALIPAASS